MPVDEWLRRIAIIEREWKYENKYGKGVEKKAKELFENHPVAITQCLLSSSKYLFKFKGKKNEKIRNKCR